MPDAGSHGAAADRAADVRALAGPAPRGPLVETSRGCAELGLLLTYVRDRGVCYLRVSSAGQEDPLSLLLPAGPGQPTAGVAVFSRLGRWYARHWALVWGAGGPPASGVTFSSGDLRFRRQVHGPALLVGPVWVAAVEGGYRQATVDPDGPAPQWLPLASSW